MPSRVPRVVARVAIRSGPIMVGDADNWGARRTRIVEWHAPEPGTATGMTLAGIDYLRGMADGRLPIPPMAQLMAIHAVDVHDGRVAFGCTPDESMYNATGAIHGGMACTLLDFVCSCALLSTLPAGKTVVSVEIKVSFLKVVHPRVGSLQAIGTVVKRGARVGFTEGNVTDANGVVVATATSSVLVVDV
ncbi:PaaI family thioesterase [Mycobacterium sp. 236(2023)]|uniref:PaaI family thioesterase n=1 Tax=Mycobacterium sp. 236(2023) TaxID=3038163 RepID=UPI00241558D7|nr:PaaI family thioesterase [Mycobacterium sp. 236(2023)]MDG4665600.1 PaaI family thioesterase [Mycobacterium sp. 236(2023)]